MRKQLAALLTLFFALDLALGLVSFLEISLELDHQGTAGCEGPRRPSF